MRGLALICGILVLCLIWAGPLLTTWRTSFASHMLAHMGVVATAAPLLAIGLSSYTKALRAPAWLPLLASLVDLVIVWGWHTPAMRSLAETSTPATITEQAMFLFAGLFLWMACLQHPQAEGQRAAAGAFGLLFTSIHMTLLGALLALTPRPLYGLTDVSCFGLTLNAANDQVLGGVLMLFLGAAAYLAGGVGLLARVLRDVPNSNAEPT